MTNWLAAGLILANFTVYPSLGGGAPVSPLPAERPQARVEAVTDRGPILELIIGCPAGAAIISYSKVERLYCSPQLTCNRNMHAIVIEVCH